MGISGAEIKRGKAAEKKKGEEPLSPKDIVYVLLLIAVFIGGIFVMSEKNAPPKTDTAAQSSGTESLDRFKNLTHEQRQDANVRQ